MKIRFSQKIKITFFNFNYNIFALNFLFFSHFLHFLITG
jgi:hypothetical protein